MCFPPRFLSQFIARWKKLSEDLTAFVTKTSIQKRTVCSSKSISESEFIRHIVEDGFGAVELKIIIPIEITLLAERLLYSGLMTFNTVSG